MLVIFNKSFFYKDSQLDISKIVIFFEKYALVLLIFLLTLFSEKNCELPQIKDGKLVFIFLYSKKLLFKFILFRNHILKNLLQFYQE
jgi:hypothetical protein